MVGMKGDLTMKSTDYYRQLSDAELLLHGKEALTYTNEFVVALIERYEDVLEGLSASSYREESLEDRVADLGEEVAAMAAQIKELET
jgi:hypothetical protein